MDSDSALKNLHPLEIRVLRGFAAGETISAETLGEKLSFNQGQTNQATSWLAAKNFIAETGRVKRTLYELTELGERYRESGTPEERILSILSEQGPMTMPRIASATGLENRDVGSAYGQLSKEGLVSMDGEKRAALSGGGDRARIETIRALLERTRTAASLDEAELSATEREAMNGISKKRGAASSAFRTVEREEVSFALTPEGLAAAKALERLGVSGDEVGTLTPEMLASGGWKNKTFRRYNLGVPPARVFPGRRNPYCEFLEQVKDKLTALGFEEFDGPLVETEFWNSDALFMPQFHSARDIHDVYHLADPTHAKEIEQPYLDNVAAAHEDGWNTGSRGWQYRFDREFTRRLILRSQGTVLSAKSLPEAKIPGKYFGIVRCFRYDKVDATHLSDFYQTEGIVLGETVNLKTLLGLLKMFAEEVAGAKEVMYVPGYFPFTEPSVEVHIKHPVLGWFELGGAGIFRPEVTEPLGIHVPVLAWGLGIDRMALMQLGLSDLRELFSPNIENIRLRRRS